MSSGYIPPKDEPGLDDILGALESALRDDPRLAESSEEEIARQLVHGDYLKHEPAPTLVAEALHTIETEGRNPT